MAPLGLGDVTCKSNYSTQYRPLLLFDISNTKSQQFLFIEHNFPEEKIEITQFIGKIKSVLFKYLLNFYNIEKIKFGLSHLIKY